MKFVVDGSTKAPLSCPRLDRLTILKVLASETRVLSNYCKLRKMNLFTHCFDFRTNQRPRVTTLSNKLRVFPILIIRYISAELPKYRVGMSKKGDKKEGIALIKCPIDCVHFFGKAVQHESDTI
jgi:hypothetical protein